MSEFLNTEFHAGDKVWLTLKDYETKNSIVVEGIIDRMCYVQGLGQKDWSRQLEITYQIYDWFYNDGRMANRGMFANEDMLNNVIYVTKEEAINALTKCIFD